MTTSDNFNFFVPLTLSKGGANGGNTQEMFLEGIASTNDRDADGEYLDPNGFDLDYFMKAGIVNWHHQAAKDPDAIIGEPVSAKVTDKGLHIKVRLYPDDPLARKVFNKAAQMEAHSDTRRMGFSIEGQATERKSSDENHPDYAIVTKAMLTGVAVTHMPKNANTFATICKALGTGNGDALIKESLDEDLKTTTDAPEEKPKKDDEKLNNEKAKHNGLNKAIALEVIFSQMGDITVSSAENIYRLAQHISASTMAKGKNDSFTNDVTEQDITKAVQALQLSKGKESDDDDDDDDDEDDDKMEKGITSNLNTGKAFGVLVKGLNQMTRTQQHRDANLGVLLKGMYDQFGQAIGKIEEQAVEIDELRKGMNELTELLEQPVQRKAVTSSPRERDFSKGLEGGDLSEKDNTKKNTVSINNKPLIKGILSDLTFSKGFNPDIAQAALRYDSAGSLTKATIDLIRAEKGFEIVAE